MNWQPYVCNSTEISDIGNIAAVAEEVITLEAPHYAHTLLTQVRKLHCGTEASVDPWPRHTRQTTSERPKRQSTGT